MDINNKKNNDAFDAIQAQALEKQKQRLENVEPKKYEFDKLRMYFGKDFTLDLSFDKNLVHQIVIRQPKIGDILEIGESEFYGSLSPFLYNSTSCRLQLWKMGVDWNKVRDIEICAMYLKTSNAEVLKYTFPTVDMTDFELVNIGTQEEIQVALYSKSQGIVITEQEYVLIAEYIRAMLNIHPKVEHVKGRTAKEWVIQEEEMNAYRQKEKNTGSSSTLLPLVSALVNHPGFKYRLEELENVGICQFMDAVQRIQKYESSIATLHGMCSGFVDGSKIDAQQYNFMGEI